MCSSPDLFHCPEDSGSEVAFAGRSNAGKSSAINRLCAQTKLARTSKTPGRTQQLNFFSLDEQRRLVDLPGYGYAKVPDTMKLAWQQSMQDYLENRQSLKGLILLVDIRHPPKQFDLMMMHWAIQHQMPLHVLLTKADKLKRGAIKQALQTFKKEMVSNPESQLSVQSFSAFNGEGVEQADKVIQAWLNWNSLH